MILTIYQLIDWAAMIEPPLHETAHTVMKSIKTFLIFFVVIIHLIVSRFKFTDLDQIILIIRSLLGFTTYNCFRVVNAHSMFLMSQSLFVVIQLPYEHHLKLKITLLMAAL